MSFIVLLLFAVGEFSLERVCKPCRITGSRKQTFLRFPQVAATL
jgi:hypothetical protein